MPMGDRQRTYMCEMMEHLGIEPAGGVIPRRAKLRDSIPPLPRLQISTSLP
jgi:hypothetical protein